MRTKAVGAEALVPVAPNWNMNEDLLGYYNPRSTQYLRHSAVLRNLGIEYERAVARNWVCMSHII